MARDSNSQEVNCVVALPIALYPSLLHRKLATNTCTPTAASPSGGQTGVHPREACVPGVVLEVRQLWQPTHSGRDDSVSTTNAFSAKHICRSTGASSASCIQTAAPASCDTKRRTASSVQKRADLYAFVRVKDTDHRVSGWFPLRQVFVKSDSAVTAFGASGISPQGSSVSSNAEADESATGAVYGLTDDWTPLSRVLHQPWLSTVYNAVTPGMARTQRAHRQLDYLEERLLRDCRTPTTVRYFVYLNTYVFAPWYYAPFGLLNSEYDPTLPSGRCAQQQCNATGTDVTAATASLQEPQPYIRDAFLCPFSLRIFSTYAQLHYETRAYRAGRLRPPGEEIYRDEVRGLSLFRINGSQHVTYCRHLFLIGKSFLENKLAGHDVHSYYFYVVCLHHRYFPHYVSDASAMYFAGFFTWEKHVSEYNLACIATLPCFGCSAVPSRSPPPAKTSLAGNHPGGQATSDVSASTSPSRPPLPRNIGQFMIAVSYELAYRRRQIGTPEKPLSDLGEVAYQHYWRRVLVRWMKATLNEMRRAAALDVDGVAAVASSDKQSDVLQPPNVLVDVEAVPFEKEKNETDTNDGGNAMTARSGVTAANRKRSRTAAASTPDEADGEDDDGAGVAEGGENNCDEATIDKNTKTSQLRVPSSPSASPTKSVLHAVTFDNASSPQTTFTSRTTIKEIAAAVRLEEVDVLKTLLGLGVLHRSSEDRSLRLLLPQRYIDWLYDEVLRWESSAAHAVFQPPLLRSRGRAK